MSEQAITAAAGPAGPGAGAPGRPARSPIRPDPPVVMLDGWEVSGRRAAGAALTLTDCTPLAKVAVRAPAGGAAQAALGAGFGRAARSADGILVTGSGPGEWLLIGPAGSQEPGLARAAAAADAAAGELVTWVDLTHGRALVRLTGAAAPRLLARLCGIDLADRVTGDHSALRSSVANLATDIIRDDCRGQRSYLLHCERSSGQYLFDALRDAGADLGLETAGFTWPAGEHTADSTQHTADRTQRSGP